jgi:hypothetical protein
MMKPSPFYIGVLGFTLIEDSVIEDQKKRWALIAPPGSNGTGPAKARGVEQTSTVGNQCGGRVFLFLHIDEFWGEHKLYQSHVWYKQWSAFLKPPFFFCS